MILELINESLNSLRSNLLRTLLTMIGIILGVSAVVLIMTMGTTVYTAAEDSIYDSGLGNINITLNYAGPGSNFTLNQDLITSLEQANVEGVRSYEPSYSYSMDTLIKDNGDQFTLGYQYSQEKNLQDLEFVAGQTFTRAQVNSQTPIVIIDETTAQAFYGSASQALGETLNLSIIEGGLDLEIVGVTQTPPSMFGPNDSFGSAHVPFSLGEISTMVQTYGYSQIAVVSQLGTDYTQVTTNIEEALMNIYGYSSKEELPFSVSNAQDLIGTISGTMTAFSVGLSLIAALSLLVGGVGIMNIMLVNVTERTKEIGLLKALGAREQDIIFQFIVESVVLTVVGGLIGVILGLATSALGVYLANIFGPNLSLPVFHLTLNPTSIFVSLAVSCGIGLIFGIYPAKKAAKLDPVDALRRD